MDETSDLDARVTIVEQRLDSKDEADKRRDANIQRLDDDMTEIRGRLGMMATKEDVAAVSAQIDKSINGILRDALNAVPAQWATVWTGVAALLAVAGLALGFLHVGH